jgi:hypothetical protein
VPLRQAPTDGEAGLHWTVLAERLAARWPDRYAGLTADAISAQLRDAQVPSVTVSAGGAKARGCRRDAIEAITAAAVTARSDGRPLTHGGVFPACHGMPPVKRRRGNGKHGTAFRLPPSRKRA